MDPTSFSGILDLGSGIQEVFFCRLLGTLDLGSRPWIQEVFSVILDLGSKKFELCPGSLWHGHQLCSGYNLSLKSGVLKPACEKVKYLEPLPKLCLALPPSLACPLANHQNRPANFSTLPPGITSRCALALERGGLLVIDLRSFLQPHIVMLTC